jgi:predicted esterase
MLYDSTDGVNSNILILLQGFGDTQENFVKFALKMKLPQTGILSLAAPHPIPLFDNIKSWYAKYDSEGIELPLNSMKVRDSLAKIRDSLLQFITHKVKLVWPLERIFILGFSMGATLALDIGLHLNLGGIVAISGGLESKLYTEIEIKSFMAKTESLLTYGDQETFINNCISFSQINQVSIPYKKHSMPKCRVEMEAIMLFFSSRLWLRNLALEKMADVYEI